MGVRAVRQAASMRSTPPIQRCPPPKITLTDQSQDGTTRSSPSSYSSMNSHVTVISMLGWQGDVASYAELDLAVPLVTPPQEPARAIMVPSRRLCHFLISPRIAASLSAATLLSQLSCTNLRPCLPMSRALSASPSSSVIFSIHPL